MKKITLGMVALMTLFLTSSSFAQSWLDISNTPTTPSSSDTVDLQISYDRESLSIPAQFKYFYCITGGCDPVTEGTEVTVTASQAVTVYIFDPTTVPAQANGTIVRWVGQASPFFGATQVSPVQEYTVDDALGVDDFALVNAQIFPNPASSQVTIAGLDSVDHVAIYNMLGARVIETNQLRINTSSLKAGLYLLQIESNGASTTKKLIIE